MIDGHDSTTPTSGTGPPEVVTLSGDGAGETDPIALAGGSYEVEFDLSGECNYEANLMGISSSSTVVAGSGPTTGTWIISGVEPGDYAVFMNAGPTTGEDTTPSCPWSIVMTRR